MAIRARRANKISPWGSPTPTLQIWMDASLHGGKIDCGSHFQYTWSEQEKGKHINWLELRAARYALLESKSRRSGTVNMIAITFIRRLGGTRSPTVWKESYWLWWEAINRNITILLPHLGRHLVSKPTNSLPQWLASKANAEADFLSRRRLQRWNFKLIRVLEDLLQTVSVAHTGSLRIQGDL